MLIAKEMSVEEIYANATEMLLAGVDTVCVCVCAFVSLLMNSSLFATLPKKESKTWFYSVYMLSNPVLQTCSQLDTDVILYEQLSGQEATVR